MKIRTRAGAVGLIAGASAVLAACTPSSTADLRPGTFVADPVVSAQASERFGGDADEAYLQVADLMLDAGFALDSPSAGGERQHLVQPLIPSMTADAAHYWERTVDEALAGDQRAGTVIDLLRITELPDPEVELRGSPVGWQEVVNGEVDLHPERDDALRLVLEHNAGIDVTWKQQSQSVLIMRDLTFTLVPSEDGQRWLIDEFEGDLDWDRARDAS